MLGKQGPIGTAYAFASAAHGAIGQKRKYSGQDYIVHPTAVYAILSLYCATPPSEELLQAAFLHDVVEDTQVPLSLIKQIFGEKVAQIVSEVTNVSKPSDGNRETRKALDRDHLKLASREAKTLKLADIFDNTSDLRLQDPGFARVYVGEKKRLLPFLVEGDPNIYAMVNRVLNGI